MGFHAENEKESDSPLETVQNPPSDLPVPPDGGYGWVQVLVAQ